MILANAQPVPSADSAPGPKTSASEVRSGIATHLPGLMTHAQSLCRSHDRAQDLVQSTVLRALRFEATFREGSNLRAWLHQILVSVFVGNYRSTKRERRALTRFGSDPCSWMSDRGTPESQGLSPRVQRALNQLPAPFAAAVRSVDLDGQGYQDAANEAGVPLGTVMSRLFRGRRLLRSALSDPHLNDASVARAA
jgi:RNA polymerase sigma-70 factor (ECF subfamily)